MKIINKTNYNTLSIKKLFTRCLIEDERVEGRLSAWQRKKLYVIVKYSKTSMVSGYAIISGCKIVMRLPKENIQAKIEVVAWIFIHELAHIRGYRHRHISNKPYIDVVKSWANEYKIEMKEIKEKTKTDIKVVRYEQVCKKIEVKERILKRVQNQIKKWNSKKKYYERVLMAAKQEVKTND